MHFNRGSAWGGHHFLWNGGGVIPKVPRQYFCDPPYLMIKNFMASNVEETCNPHCILGAISLNKIFIKLCSHPIISWFFCDPLFLIKKFCSPPIFSWPPYSEENDSHRRRQPESSTLFNIIGCRLWPNSCRYNAPTDMVHEQLCSEWPRLRYWSPVQFFCHHQINNLRQNLYQG